MEYHMTYNVDKIVQYLEPLKDRLNELYQWKIKLETLEKLVKFEICSQDEINKLNQKDIFTRNIALKKLLAPKFKQFSSLEDIKFKNLSIWIIKNWGGIRTGNDDNTMQSIKDLLENGYSFERIASTSKVASFKEPTKYAIYDSRVAYSLNWIILSQNAGNKFFPMPKGRNAKLNAFDMEVLIRQKNITHYQIKNTAELNKRFIRNQDKTLYLDKDNAYNEFNKLIKVVNQKLWQGDKEKSENLYYTEMLLFAIADTEIYKDITDRLKLEISKI